jgi:hypothetical protein
VQQQELCSTVSTHPHERCCPARLGIKIQTPNRHLLSCCHVGGVTAQEQAPKAARHKHISPCCVTCMVLFHLACRREAFVVPFIPSTVPGWSDACFEPVEWPGSGHPCSDGDQGWCIVRSPATDADGWVYGTAFDHLREDRPGGRASKRTNDRVRSRLWRRVDAAAHQQVSLQGAAQHAVSELLQDAHACWTRRCIAAVELWPPRVC